MSDAGPLIAFANRPRLDYIGTVRTLLLAERNAIIPDAEAAVEGMAQRGYRISPQLLRQLRTRTAARP